MLTHSFVIVAYGQSPHLEACISSLKAQQMSSEIMITTSTPSQYLEYLSKKHEIPYYVNFKGAGSIGADWNFAISKAKTALVTLAHQDDIYEPSFSNNVVGSFKKFKSENVSLIFTDYTELIGGEIRKESANRFIKQLLLFPYKFTGRLQNKVLKKMTLALGDPICCPTVTLNRLKFPEFRFDECFYCALDWEGWYRLASEKGSFIFIAKKLLQHRIHEGSETTVQITSGGRANEEFLIFKKIWGTTIAKMLSKLYCLGHKSNHI